MRVLRAPVLSADPLAAGAAFYDWLKILTIGEDLLLVFAPADHTHRAWRLAAIQGLARQATPARVNAVASDDEAAIAAAADYLAAAPGLTGQYLPLDGAGAGSVIESGQ